MECTWARVDIALHDHVGDVHRFLHFNSCPLPIWRLEFSPSKMAFIFPSILFAGERLECAAVHLMAAV